MTSTYTEELENLFSADALVVPARSGAAVRAGAAAAAASLEPTEVSDLFSEEEMTEEVGAVKPKPKRSRPPRRPKAAPAPEVAEPSVAESEDAVPVQEPVPAPKPKRARPRPRPKPVPREPAAVEVHSEHAEAEVNDELPPPPKRVRSHPTPAAAHTAAPAPSVPVIPPGMLEMLMTQSRREVSQAEMAQMTAFAAQLTALVQAAGPLVQMVISHFQNTAPSSKH